MSYVAYLKLEGIAGGCVDPGHRDWLPIDCFSQTVSGPPERSGAPHLSDFSFSRQSDRATPFLARAAAEGRQFPEAVLELCATEGAKPPIMEIRMTDVTVTSFTISGSPQGDVRVPFENLSVRFERIEWVFHPNARVTGREKEPGAVRADWNLSAAPSLR